ncbi:helix-turn-helix domain-containing protein [Streptococcus anginosus]|uniref:helix-turn-helix domain-containing protein n=1 Tax=Streptococcus anginosus TaxID=1328 RepID=UPI0021F83438|nr:helix-turn-helix transcriptional regulator [Streptococcus anginosus]MCW0996788.1 helix-turn-helix domain-containing protein [Streptococcus anginosus]
MRLKELRQKRGMVRADLAKEIGTTVRSISRWENGETDILLGTAIQLAKFFEVSLDEFVG